MHDARVVHHEGLPPFFENMPPGITPGSPDKNAKLLGARIELINTAVVISNHTKGGFHLGMQKNALLEIDPTTRTAAPRADRVMIVLNAKTSQGQFLHIGHIITVGIFKEEDIGRLPHINSSISELDSGRQVKTVCKNSGLVGRTVTVGIFENDDLIIRHITGLELRVGPRAGHPEPPAGVPVHMHGVRQHGIRSKKIHLVAVQQLEVLQLRLRVVIVHQFKISALKVRRLDTA